MRNNILDESLDRTEQTKIDDKKRKLDRLFHYQKLLNELVRVRDVNKEELADLIIRAKGPKRSIRQFAIELGVNPSTLTRIINLQTVGASKNELIVKIAEMADPESGVTLEQLLDAHGVERQKVNDINFYRIKAEKRMRQIVTDEFIACGYMVIVESIGKSHRNIYDLVLESKEEGNYRRWAFEFKSVRDNSVPAGIGSIYRWIDHAMATFYRGNASVDKITLVVELRVIFDQIKEILSRYTIPDEISVMLIGNDKILDEYITPRL